jgi:hypothetical protein
MSTLKREEIDARRYRSFDEHGNGVLEVAQCRQMMRNLLEDRFRLTTHFETQKVPAFALVVDKSGRKFHEAPADATAATLCIAYYLAAARVEARDFDGVAESLRPVYAGEVTSRFAGRSWILQVGEKEITWN